MKILCVIDDLNSGGAQRQLVTIAVYLKEQGFFVDFLTYFSNDDFFKPVLEDNKINVFQISPKGYIDRILQMRKKIRNGKYDIVLSFLETPSFICEIIGLPSREWKLVVGERSANPKILSSLKLKTYRWFHVFADAVVSNSYTNMEMVKKVNPFLNRNKLYTIYNYVNVEKYSSEEIYLRSSKLKLIIVASHQSVKNLNLLVDSVFKLESSFQDNLCIEWYGDRIEGEYYDCSFPDAKEKINKRNLNHVFSFFPATTDIEDKIKRADFVMLLSNFEGLSNVICEGMTLGKPIIATSVSDNSKLIKNGFNGFLCLPNESDIIRVLKEAINLSGDEILKMGSNSKKMAENLFSIENTLEKYKNLFEKIAGLY